MTGVAAWALAWLPSDARAQQGTVQVSAAAQTVTGPPERLAGEHALEPDFGISWVQPGDRFGSFHLELRGARRADRLHVGRNYAALRDLKHGAVSWTFEAGDAYFTRALGEYGFANLSTPAVTLSGGVVTGRSARGTLHLVGGRTTAWRNIFGTDPDTLAQTIGMVRGGYKLSDRLEVLGRVSRIQTSGLREFTFTIADGKQAGGGVRFAWTPALQLIADGSLVQYRRLDSNMQEWDGSFLAGANLLLSRGWVQVNASRFSPGEFPAMNDPLHDRETAFAAGEYDLATRLRAFAGFEAVRTNIDPDATLAASLALPVNRAWRGFGGVRLRVGEHSTLTLRRDDGDRIARSVRGGLDTESDTGSHTAEWQAAVGPATAYTRYTRRADVNSRNADASYTQQDVSSQVFVRVTRTTQVFGLAAVTRHETGTAQGSTYWQLGGGGQVQIGPRNLWLRGEGTASRNVDLVTREFVPRESFNFGMNGQLARGTAFSFTIAADRSPFFASATPWTTRSIFRVTQNFSTGAARVLPGGAAGAAGVRARGAGTIIGVVYADWNANGTLDPDETPLENIPVRVASLSAVTTRRDGEFSFLNVPAGPQQVGLDTGALPIDFDPPAVSAVDLELDRGATRRVSFGLIPLGAVHGRVVRDTNANGKVDPGEEPIDGAVLVLDGGSRSEQARRGVFRFDSIRSGDHVVSLLRDSLPEGAVITGASEVPVALTRNQLDVAVDFLVTIEKRPEMRRVFPPRAGQQPPMDAAARPAAPAPPPRGSNMVAAPLRPAPPQRTSPTAPGSRPPASSGRFAVQIAALSDPLRARLLVEDLSAAGFPAYVVTPGVREPGGPYRVRVGRYRTRDAASGAATTLQKVTGEKLWVVQEPVR